MCDFLDAVRVQGKRLVLVTNAHGKSLNIKFRRTPSKRSLRCLWCAPMIWTAEGTAGILDKMQEVEPVHARHGPAY